MSSMAQHRYRQGKVKREHTIIEGLLPLLTSIAELPEVDSIIPGRINQRSRTGETGLFFQYQTETGLKLLGRSKLAVQEVFVVTSQPQAVLEALIARRLVKTPGNGRSAGASKVEDAKRSGAGDTKEAGETRDARDTGKVGETRGARDTREAGETRSSEDTREADDTRGAEDTREAGETRGSEDTGKTGEAGDAAETKKAEDARKVAVAGEAGAPTSRVDTSGAPARRTNTQRNRPRAKRGGPTTKRAGPAQQHSAQDAAQSQSQRTVVENTSQQGAPQSARKIESGGPTPFREQPPPEIERVEPKLWNELLRLHNELLRLEEELTKELQAESHVDTAGERNPSTRPTG